MRKTDRIINRSNKRIDISEAIRCDQAPTFAERVEAVNEIEFICNVRGLTPQEAVNQYFEGKKKAAKDSRLNARD